MTAFEPISKDGWDNVAAWIAAEAIQTELLSHIGAMPRTAWAQTQQGLEERAKLLDAIRRMTCPEMPMQKSDRILLTAEFGDESNWPGVGI